MRDIERPGLVGEDYRATEALHRNPPCDRFGTYLQLRAVVRGFEEALEVNLEAHGVTIAEFCALRLLVDDGPQSLSLVSKWVSISNSGTTKLVDRLESRGLAARTRDTKDRRVIRVEPTDAGLELVRQVFPGHLENIEMLLGHLTDAEVGNLHELLARLRTDVEAGIPAQEIQRSPSAKELAGL